MRKLLSLLIALCTIIALPASLALAGEAQTVTLGDGAAIPYFDGYTSDAVDMDALPGITGAVGQTYEQIYYGVEQMALSVTVENIAITDDVIALFMRVKGDGPLPMEGRMDYHLGNFMSYVPIWQGETYMAMGQAYGEGRLISDNELYTMQVYSLETPIDPSQPLLIGADDPNGGEGMPGFSLMIDVSQRVDPTVAVGPMPEETRTITTYTGSDPITMTLRVDRVAFTPFGNRLMLSTRQTSEMFLMNYVIMDDAGNVLPRADRGGRSSSIASEEHPVWTANEAWFAGGRDAASISVVPEQYYEIYEGYENHMKLQMVPLANVPSSVALENGSVIHLKGVTVGPEGFAVDYVPEGYTGHISFDLAGADGESAGLNYVSISGMTPRTGIFTDGGYWSEMYKDRTVARVSEADIAGVAGVLIDYRVEESELLKDAALVVPLR